MPFPVVLRGYRREDVDLRLGQHEAEVHGLRAELDELRRRSRALSEHSAYLEAELARLSGRTGRLPVRDRRDERGARPRERYGSAPAGGP